MTDGTLRHALAFATAGWPVLPCLPGQKIPATAHGRPSADPGSRLAYPVHETGTNEQTTIVDMVCAEGQGTAVRIGAPARKHGVGDADILHAVRTAIRKIDMDDDLTMLIGPARDGAPLEIGVLDLDGEDPVVIHAMRLRPKFYPLIGQG